MIEVKPDTESAKGAFSTVFSDVLDLKCKGLKQISKICCQPDCQHPSLHCQSKQCQCYKNHEFCFLFGLQSWAKLLKERIDIINKSLVEFAELEKNVLAKMAEIKNGLNDMIHFGWMDSKYVEMLREIYVNQNSKHLTGKMGRQFSIFLQQQSKRQQIDQNLQRVILEQFVEKSNRIIEEFQNLKSETICALIKCQAHSPLSIPSKIAQKKQDSQLLCVWLKNPIKIQLIFRASEHGFSAAKFHQICDNIPHTLVVAKTQFGKRIGGYTQLTWNSANNNCSNDGKGQSFIFSLDLRQKMTLTQPQHAICCSNSYGPTFGGGHDIHLSNECNNNNKSYTYFPQSYNQNCQYINGQQSYTAFCGAQSGYNFKVEEYEVFKVSWK